MQVPSLTEEQRGILPTLYFFGNPVEPQDFAGRKDIISEVRRLIEVSKGGKTWNISIEGDRRMGKTSLLKYLECDLSKEKNYLPIYINTERCSSPLEFLQRIIEEITIKVSEKLNGVGFGAQIKEFFGRKSFGDIFKNLSLELELCGVKVTKEFSGVKVGDSFKKDLIGLYNRLEGEGYKIILLIDEIDVFGEEQEGNGITNKVMLGILRDVIQHLKVSEEKKGYIFIIGSALPLYKATVMIYSPFANIFRAIDLAGFTDAEAEEFIRRPMRYGISIKDEVIDKLKRLSGNKPFYLQILCSKIMEYLMINNQRNISCEVVDFAKEDALRNQHFSYLWDRASSVQKKILELASQKESITSGEIKKEFQGVNIHELTDDVQFLLRRHLLRKVRDKVYCLDDELTKIWLQRRSL